MRVNVETSRVDIGAAVTDAAVVGMRLAMERVLQVSQQRVPFDEGFLQSTGESAVDVQGTTVVGGVGYDGPYAVVQHERLDFVHPNGRQAKYLESAFADEAETIRRILATQIRRAVGS